jgi:hypothetical protein
MPLVYRPAREQDLERAQELVVRSINDLTERHGFGPIAIIRPTQFHSFSLKDDPDGLWVAEDAGEILGFAFSWVCGELWFLAELFDIEIGAFLIAAGNGPEKQELLRLIGTLVRGPAATRS